MSNPHLCASSQHTDQRLLTKGFLPVSFSRVKKGLEKGMELSNFRGNGLSGLVVVLKEECHTNRTQTSSSTIRSGENVKLQTGIFQELKNGKMGVT